DKDDLTFLYLSGIILTTDVQGITYDKTTHTLTFKNVELSKDNTHYSLTITNMGEDFKLNVVGTNSLDYLSLESIGYNTGCTITGPGTLDIGYLDISSDGSAMNVTIDNTVTFSADSAKMGYETLPAVKVSSKVPLTEMESMIKVLGKTNDQLVFEETPSTTSYAYETTISKIQVTPTRVVKQGTDGKWGYYVNDKLDTTFNGLAGNQFGTWKITNGLVDFLYQGLFESQNGTFMIKDGQVDLTFNGLAPNAKGKWFVQNGEVQFNYVGPVVLNGQKYTVDKGQVK
ncbi:MAG: hypothetical protein UHK59_01975, partial [Acutalibacteraceae bacterium]|nr:hypothetical protein [Acutalibacteraceae bacterium]